MLLFVTILFGFHGVIENDTTWSDTAYLTGDVLVNSGVTLNIDPGTVVLYADSCEWDTAWDIEEEWGSATLDSKIDLVIEGNINAVGTAGDSVWFYPATEDDKAHGKILLVNGSNTLRYCNIIHKHWYYEWAPFIYTGGTETEISSCYFESGGGIQGRNSRIFVYDCEFYKVLNAPILLIGGFLKVENCFFSESDALTLEGLGIYWDFGAIIYGEELDSFIVKNVVVEGAEGMWRTLDGGNAAGCLCFKCQHAEIFESEFRLIRGGYADSGAGVGGIGGNGYALYLEECTYMFSESNVIKGISGGEGVEGSMADGYGGNGYGFSIKTCEEVAINNNKISDIFGGIGTSAPNNENDGSPWPLVCSNSSPVITSNEFNSAGTYIYINSTSQPIIGGAPGRGNRFLNYNGWNDYVIYNNSPYDIDATWNFWECSPSMIDSLIFDYYDDPTKGIVHYDNFTDVEEESLTQPLTLRSNLVKDVLHVSLAFDCAGGEPRLSLFDASGRRVLSMPVSGPEIEIDVSAFSRGVYFISIGISEKPLITRKVILN